MLAYYCGECVLWQNSEDANRYGERWCKFSRRYEKYDQNIYGCRGFIYSERAVLTKVCDILGVPADIHFQWFDLVKEKYVVPNCMRELVEYAAIGPKLADLIDQEENKYSLAHMLYNRYISSAKEQSEARKYEQAYSTYKEMILELRTRYEN